MVIIQDCSGKRPQIISRTLPNRSRLDINDLKAQAAELRGKANALRRDCVVTVAVPVVWRRVAMAATVHGLLLMAFSTCIQAASGHRHLQTALPWLVRLTVVFMLSLAGCTLVYLGQGKQTLIMVGVTFSLECLVLHCLASFSTSHSGRVPFAYYEVLAAATLTAVLSQVWPNQALKVAAIFQGRHAHKSQGSYMLQTAFGSSG
mmetsp:Transcript_27187/g.50917  ORF Transcript_27187/g.50917 Transcript_27187/m.50917 type:complete len:204 (-) Transcript_27187:151-762(-)